VVPGFWFAWTCGIGVTILEFQLFNLFRSGLSSIRINWMSDMCTLQLATELKEGSTPLFVSVLQHSMVREVTSHPRWITCRRTGGNRVEATLNSTNIVVVIMFRAITMSVIGKRSGAVENTTAGMADGNAIDDKYAAFLCE
jgi:hypothetical protein